MFILNGRQWNYSAYQRAARWWSARWWYHGSDAGKKKNTNDFLNARPSRSVEQSACKERTCRHTDRHTGRRRTDGTPRRRKRRVEKRMQYWWERRSATKSKAIDQLRVESAAAVAAAVDMPDRQPRRRRPHDRVVSAHRPTDRPTGAS